MKKEQDIVFEEAFKVVKDDFFSRLTEEEGLGFDESLGFTLSMEEEKEIVMNADKLNNTFTNCFAQLLKEADTLNNFVGLLRTFILNKESQKQAFEKRKHATELMEKIGPEMFIKKMMDDLLNNEREQEE